MKLYNQLIYT